MNRPLLPAYSIRSVLILALSLLPGIFLTPSAHADLIPDGYKNVQSVLLFEGMENFPGTTFVLYPLRVGSDKGEEVQKGKNVAFYHLCQPNLYAFKAGTDLSNPAVFADAAVPRSNVKIGRISNVPVSNPANLIRRVYRITGISGTTVALEQQPDEVFDAAGKLLAATTASLTNNPGNTKNYILAGAAGLFVVMVLVFTLGRGKRGAAAATQG